MAVSYSLRWPGLPRLPVYIVNTERHLVYGHNNPLPLDSLQLNILGNKYVRNIDVMKCFMPASRAKVSDELEALVKREHLSNLYKHTDGEYYMHLTAFLVFILVYPMCIEFQKTRKAVFSFLMRYPEVPCLDCGYIKRDCQCGDESIGVDEVGAFESQEVVAKLTDLEEASTQTANDCPLCMNKLMYAAWSEGKGPVVIMPKGQKMAPHEKLPLAVANALASGKLAQGANVISTFKGTPAQGTPAQGTPAQGAPAPLRISCPPVTQGESVKDPVSILHPPAKVVPIKLEDSKPSVKLHELTLNDDTKISLTIPSIVPSESAAKAPSDAANNDPQTSDVSKSSSATPGEIVKTPSTSSEQSAALADGKTTEKSSEDTATSTESSTHTTISAMGQLTNVSGLPMNWMPLNASGTNLITTQAGFPQMTTQLPGGMAWVRFYQPQGAQGASQAPMYFPYPQQGMPINMANPYMYPMMGGSAVPGTTIQMNASQPYGSVLNTPTTQSIYPTWRPPGPISGQISYSAGFPTLPTWSGKGTTPTINQANGASPMWTENTLKATPPSTPGLTPQGKKHPPPYPYHHANKSPHIVNPTDLMKKKKKKKRKVDHLGEKLDSLSKKSKLVLLDESGNRVDPMSGSSSRESSPAKELNNASKLDGEAGEEGKKEQTTKPSQKSSSLSKTKKLSRSLTDLTNLSASFLKDVKKEIPSVEDDPAITDDNPSKADKSAEETTKSGEVSPDEKSTEKGEGDKTINFEKNSTVKVEPGEIQSLDGKQSEEDPSEKGLLEKTKDEEKKEDLKEGKKDNLKVENNPMETDKVIKEEIIEKEPVESKKEGSDEVSSNAPNSTDKEVADVLLAMSVLGANAPLPTQTTVPDVEDAIPEKDSKDTSETLNETKKKKVPTATLR